MSVNPTLVIHALQAHTLVFMTLTVNVADALRSPPVIRDGSDKYLAGFRPPSTFSRSDTRVESRRSGSSVTLNVWLSPKR